MEGESPPVPARRCRVQSSRRIYACGARSLRRGMWRVTPRRRQGRFPGTLGLSIEARGNFLYLLCAGHGSPTVILEAGLGGDHRDWEPVQSEIALRTRVCSYDRLGIGFSQQAPKRATADQKADDLHALLAAANVDGPYVLVGHSYGGMLVRVLRRRISARCRRARPARLSTPRPGPPDSRRAAATARRRGSRAPRSPQGDSQFAKLLESRGRQLEAEQ